MHPLIVVDDIFDFDVDLTWPLALSQGVDSSLKRPKLDQDNDNLSSRGDDPMQVDQSTDMVVVSQDTVAGTSNVPPPPDQLPEVMNDMRLREDEPHANRGEEDKVGCFSYIWILHHLNHHLPHIPIRFAYTGYGTTYC